MGVTMNKNTRSRQSSRRATNAGFTLTELIISVAVISILAGMAAQVFSVVLDARNLALDRLEVNETGRSALNFMANEMRTAYLTPDSVKPLQSVATTESIVPRFRFGGIARMASIEDYPGIPGAQVDEDGDGDVGEEILNGFDDDGDELVDEDIGTIPSGILHFVSAIEGSSGIELQEISYGLDPSGTRLIRRAQLLSPDNNQRSIEDFGQFIDNSSGERLLPPVVGLGQSPGSGAVNNAISNWDSGARFGQIQNSGNVLPGNSPGKIFQVLSYDVRGLSFRYWYYDYNRGGWRWTSEWDSSRETALLRPNQPIFNAPAANNSLEGTNRASFANLIVNEPDDRYPTGNLPGTFLVTNPSQLTADDFSETFQRITRRTDGLPNMVEITVWVQDQDQEVDPSPYTMRVFIPNNYRSIGR